MEFVERDLEVPIIRYITKVVRALHYGLDLPKKPDGFTYRDVFTHANTHSLGGALWYALEDEVVAEGDTELIRRWSRERDLDFAKYVNHRREFAMITKAFTENEVKFLPMKGLIYRTLWARPEYRTMSDMDIYVVPECIDRAREILIELGYSLENDRGVLHFNYMKPPYVNVELHKVMEVGDYIKPEDFIPREDNPYWCELSREDFLAFNISHMHKHYTHGGCGIRSLFDLHLFLEKYGTEIDYDLLRKKLEERDVLDFYDKMCELSEFWYGDGTKAATDDIYREEYYIAGGATYGTVLNRVRYESKTEGKISYIFKRAFLPYSSMTRIYPWLEKLPFLLPVAWVMRWFRALFNGRLGREVGAIGDAEWKKGNNEENHE